METVLSKAFELANEIKQTPVCMNYLQCRDSVLKDEALKGKLERFRVMQLAQSDKAKSGEQITLDEQQAISRLYFDIKRDDTGRLFLESERQLIELIMSIDDAIFGGLGELFSQALY